MGNEIKISTVEELDTFLQENPLTKKQVIGLVNTAIGSFVEDEFSSKKVPTKEEKAILMKSIRAFVEKWPLSTDKERPLFVD